MRSLLGPHFYLKHPVASGTITLRCVTCGREERCFVPSQHGMDAELDFFPPPKEDENAASQEFACPNCEAASFAVIARFEYPATSGPAEPDLFTYFMLIVTCDSCRLILPIADVQCA